MTDKEILRAEHNKRVTSSTWIYHVSRPYNRDTRGRRIMTNEELFAQIVGYLKDHNIKELMEVVLKAIDLTNAK